MTKIELDLPEFEEYEYTGEYRPFKKNEYFLSGSEVRVATYDSNAQYPILKPKPWRAKKNGAYFQVNISAGRPIVEEIRETSDSYDYSTWKCGNYFKTEEEAERFSENLLKAFKDFHNHS